MCACGPRRNRVQVRCTSDASTSQAEREERLGNCSSATPDSSAGGADDDVAYRYVAAGLGVVICVAVVAFVLRKWLNSKQQDDVQVSFGLPLASVSNRDGDVPQLDGEMHVNCQTSRDTLLSASAALPTVVSH